MPHSEMRQALQHEEPDFRVKALKQMTEHHLTVFQDLVAENLSHADEAVQAAAAFALRHKCFPDIAPQLMAVLAVPATAVKVAAIFTLGEWQCTEAVSALASLLQSENPVLRSRTAEALRKIASPTAVEPLYAALEQEENLKVALRLAESLLSLGDERVIPVLSAALAYDDDEIRHRAVEILVSYPHAASVPILLECLKEDDQATRAAAVYVLGKVGYLDLPVLHAGLSDTVRAVRSGVAKALGELGSLAAEVWSELVVCLSDEDHRVRTRAAQALGKLGVTEAIPDLVLCLSQDGARRARWRAAEALRLLNAKSAVPSFLVALEDAYSSVRLEAIRALAEWKVTEAVSAIAEALNDERRRIRCAAAKALGDIGDYRALAPLRDALWQDPEESVRLLCTRALGQLRQNLKETAEALLQLEEQATLALTDVLQDASARVRSEAVTEIVSAQSNLAVEALLQLILDENTVLRAEAASALGQLGGERALNGLLELLNDADSQVRHAAAQGLLNLVASSQVLPHSLVESLLAFLQSDRPRLRNTAALILGQLGPEVVDDLLPLLTHENARLRASVIYVLGDVGDGRALTHIALALQDPVSRVRTAAAETMEKLIHEAIQPLIASVSHADQQVKHHAIQAMGRILHQVKPVLASSAEVESDAEMRLLAHKALEGTNENIELVL